MSGEALRYPELLEQITQEWADWRALEIEETLGRFLFHDS